MVFEIEQPSDLDGQSAVVEPTKPRLLGVLGPGLITGASDDDPSGIATYSQAGAQFRYALTWTMIFAYPLMTAVQIVSARMGRTTGRGIAGNLRQHCPPWLLTAIVAPLLIANAINIGADLGAMADASRLVVGGPQVLYACRSRPSASHFRFSSSIPLCISTEVADPVSVCLRGHPVHGQSPVDGGA
jgi:Natural resistance-associated macrophage protein